MWPCDIKLTAVAKGNILKKATLQLIESTPMVMMMKYASCNLTRELVLMLVPSIESRHCERT